MKNIFPKTVFFSPIFFLVGLTILLSLIFPVESSAQNNERRSAVDVLILPSETRFSGSVPNRTCMANDGDRGCYIVMLKTPEGYDIDYTEQTIDRLPVSVRQYLHISASQDSTVFGVVIPTAGAEIVVKNDDSDEPLLLHSFLPDRAGNILYYNVQISQQERAIADRPDEVLPDSRLRNAVPQTDSAGNEDDPENSGQVDPLGQLVVDADVNATIRVNGERIERGAERLFAPGKYTVEFEHPLGSETKTVNIQENKKIELFKNFKPSREKAIGYGLFVPGGGHIYTMQNRGYIYLLGVLGGLTYSLHTHIKYKEVEDDLDAALNRYHSGTTVDEATNARYSVEVLLDDRQEIFDRRNYALIGAAIIHGINILDILLTEPEYGYRDDRNRPEISISPVSGNSTRLSPSVRFSYSW